MARWLLSTDTFLDQIAGEAEDSFVDDQSLSEIAVSAMTFEWVLAEIELSDKITPHRRSEWRDNVIRFRELLLEKEGDVPSLEGKVLEHWGRLARLDLRHDDGSGEKPQEMSTEERLVVATALANGYTYVTAERDWNEVLRTEAKVTIEVL